MIIPRRSTSAPDQQFFRWVTPRLAMVIWLLVALTLLILPWRLLNHGYLPPDDALRHAAKAVSGKSWDQILVLRPEITLDHNPGWHAILGALHRLAGWNQERLVWFSVLSLFWLFAAAPLAWLRRPEAWLASLALLMLVFPYFADRCFVGRPLLLTAAVMLGILSLWTRPGMAPGRKEMVLSIIWIAAAVWIHGSWYLLGLLPAAFLLAQEWRKASLLALSWVSGSFLGAMATGHPIAFLHQAALIPALALGRPAPANSLVGEFQPLTGGYAAVGLIAAVIVWRWWQRRPLAQLGHDPVLWMAGIGFVLGFEVVRFWLDWGLPALALWLARQWQESEESVTWPLGARLGLAGVAALVLLGVVGSDGNRRWSQSGNQDSLDGSRAEHRAWVPEAGGILYNVDLAVFYETFFRNPHGPWRYVLGFEPAFMQAEDLAVYQELWQTLNAARACAPWVQRMTPADRLVLRGGPGTAPAMPALEWGYLATNTWVGRLPAESRHLRP